MWVAKRSLFGRNYLFTQKTGHKKKPMSSCLLSGREEVDHCERVLTFVHLFLSRDLHLLTLVSFQRTLSRSSTEGELTLTLGLTGPRSESGPRSPPSTVKGPNSLCTRSGFGWTVDRRVKLILEPPPDRVSCCNLLHDLYTSSSRSWEDSDSQTHDPDKECTSTTTRAWLVNWRYPTLFTTGCRKGLVAKTLRLAKGPRAEPVE